MKYIRKYCPLCGKIQDFNKKTGICKTCGSLQKPTIEFFLKDYVFETETDVIYDWDEKIYALKDVVYQLMIHLKSPRRLSGEQKDRVISHLLQYFQFYGDFLYHIPIEISETHIKKLCEMN